MDVCDRVLGRGRIYLLHLQSLRNIYFRETVAFDRTENIRHEESKNGAKLSMLLLLAYVNVNVICYHACVTAHWNKTRIISLPTSLSMKINVCVERPNIKLF